MNLCGRCARELFSLNLAPLCSVSLFLLFFIFIRGSLFYTVNTPSCSVDSRLETQTPSWSNEAKLGHSLRTASLLSPHASGLQLHVGALSAPQTHSRHTQAQPPRRVRTVVATYPLTPTLSTPSRSRAARPVLRCGPTATTADPPNPKPLP